MTDTARVLDWPVLLDALSQRCSTAMGRQTAAALTPMSLADISVCHDAIDEVKVLDEEASSVPVGGIHDIGAQARRAAKGEVLDQEDLRNAGATLERLEALGRFFARRDDLPTLAGFAAAIDIDLGVCDELRTAFDATGQLDELRFVELGELRRRIQSLHASIRSTLQELLTGDSLDDVLQDRFVTTRGDRYVLPIKAHAKRWDIGIVHDASGSGRTVFVEPHEVVQLNNRLRLAEAERDAEIRRILTELSRHLGSISEPVAASLQAAETLDLAQARFNLARDLDCTRPHVGEEGVIRLVRGRHPVLLLRGVTVIPNDLGIDSDQPCLVLTGPNTGGKTVALKTVGLCALLVRIGCWVPADEGSRVDRFDEIAADIGDQQTIHGDLSSFSGHVANLRSMLERARPGTLYLLDEIATGTDPGQGASLAQAVLEALLLRGARLVVTTHYAQLKALGASDDRFAVSGMEYRDGQPTYRVLPGLIGNSHALAIAQHLGIDPDIITRAREVMDVGERQLDEALQALDVQRTEVEKAAEAARNEAAALAERRLAVERREAVLKQRKKALEDEAAAAFRERLADAEKAVAAVVADLQRNPNHRRANAAKASLAAMADVAPAPEAPRADAPAVVAPGDRVRLVGMRKTGEVVSVSSNHAQVKTGAVTVRVKLDAIERI